MTLAPWGAAGQAEPAAPHPLRLLGQALLGRLALIDSVRDRGVAIHAGSGSGKSILLGRILCFQDLLRGVPQVVLDPLGPLVNELLVAIAQAPRALRQGLLDRVMYLDMTSPAVRFPLLARLPGESLVDAANRLIEAFRKLDPHLQSASIQGFNALVRVGRPTLMALCALGLPISEAESLLRRPEDWLGRLMDAARRQPDLQPVVAFFANEYPAKPVERQALAASFLNKIAPFVLDPAMRSMFDCTDGGIDLADVVARRQTVLLDFRGETDDDRRRFKTRWVYEWFMAFVKHRGPGKHLPLGLVIDELAELSNQTAIDVDLFTRDIEAAVNMFARNFSVWLSFAHQEMYQLPAAAQKTLLTMGTQVLGVTADIEAAKYLAEQFFPLDPYTVKRYENVWGSSPFGPVVIDQRIVDLPIEEQTLLAAQHLLRLQPLRFLVKQRNQSGLAQVSIRRLVGDVWASDHAAALSALRHRLSARLPIANLPPTDDAVSDRMEDATDDTPCGRAGRDHTSDDDWTTAPLW